MKRMNIYSAIVIALLIACNNPGSTETTTSSLPENTLNEAGTTDVGTKHFRGALTGGMKGDSIFFDVNGNKLENLTFKGYWRCDGRLTQERAAGPEVFFTLVNGKVNGHISEPPNGGASAWRFDLNATIDGKKASGTFRMNINGLGCNTGTLQWTATSN